MVWQNNELRDVRNEKLLFDAKAKGKPNPVDIAPVKIVNNDPLRPPKL